MPKIREHSSIPKASYVGSLIQQNFAETLHGHGFQVWDFKANTLTEYDIVNEHTYHNVNVGVGTDYDALDLTIPISGKMHIKVKWEDLEPNMTAGNKAKVTKYIRDKYQPVEIRFDRTILRKNKEGELVSANDARLIDIHNTKAQHGIFTDYLTAKGFESKDIVEILKLDDSITERLRQSGLHEERNGVEFSIPKLWIENFKSYGHALIDWENLDGVWQIVGKNQRGKTTVFDAIIYLLTGKTPATTTKEKHGDNRYINNKRDLDYAMVKGVVYMNGAEFLATRRTERTWKKSKGVKTLNTVSTSFTLQEIVCDEKGEISMFDASEDRKIQIQKSFEQAVGNIDDFLRANFINADTLTSYLTIDRSVFVDSLLRDIGLDIFEKKLNEFKEWKKDTYDRKARVVVKPDQLQDIISENQSEITGLTEELNNYQEQYKEISQKLDNAKKSRDLAISKFIPVRKELETIDLHKLAQEIDDLITEKNRKSEEYAVFKQFVNGFQHNYNESQYDIVKQAAEATRIEYRRVQGLIKGEEQQIVINEGRIWTIDQKLNAIATTEKEQIERLYNQKVDSQKAKIALMEKEYQLMESSKVCPTCKRDKDADTLNGIIASLSELKKRIEAETVFIKTLAEEKEADLDNLRIAYKAVRLTQAEPKANILDHQQKIKQIEDELVLLTSQEEKERLELAAMEAERRKAEEKTRHEGQLQLFPLQIEKMEGGISDKKQLFHDVESVQQAIAANEKNQEKLVQINSSISELEDSRDKFNTSIVSTRDVKIANLSKGILDAQAKIVAYAEQERTDMMLKAYEQCIHRDGIPTVLLRQNLSVINTEIANLLDSVNLTAFLNDSLAFKFYNYDNPDAILNAAEGSGMEKTFAALGLSMALRLVNNNSQFDTLLLDEVLGRLDSDNIEHFNTFLEQAKTKLGKIMIVEHMHSEALNPDYVINVTADKKGVSTLEVNG